MKIRLIASADRSEWLRLLNGLHPELSEDEHVPSIDAYLSGGSIDELIPAAVFVAERPDGRLAGFLELSIRNYAEGCSGDTPYVESWYVDEDVRGTGVGRALMHAAEGWACDRGFVELASDALLENELSHAAHQALGFEVVERIVVFRKPLSPGSRTVERGER
jgi:aminoglycoside 6'-N-acetyltransferase I